MRSGVAIARYGLLERGAERKGVVGDGWERAFGDRVYPRRGRVVGLRVFVSTS